MSHRSHHQAGPPVGYWKAGQAYVFAIITLFMGITVGYLLRGSSSVANAATPAGSSWDSTTAPTLPSALTPTSLIEPLLKELSTNPNDTELLVRIGNQYYDNRDYANAIEYYNRYLKLKPQDVNVRTDMGTAIWYSGDADRALREYNTSLKYQANHPQTLFNMGIVQWQGKQNRKTALELWEKLLATNPGYPERQKVEQMIQQVEQETK